MTTSIAIIDYGMGNRRSVEKAFVKVGAEASVGDDSRVAFDELEVLVTEDPQEVLDADGAVVVGVGAFPEAMTRLRNVGMVEVLEQRFADERPILGICLGMQIFFEHSYEHEGADGLGFLKGYVRKLQPNGLKVPQIGWNQVEWSNDSELCRGIPKDDSTFYHLHSYAAYDAAEPEAFLARPEVVGKTTYTCEFATAVEKPPVYGVQFHPEKSSRQGLQLLENFADICARAKLPV